MALVIVPNQFRCYVKDEFGQVCNSVATFIIAGEDFNPTLANGTVIAAACGQHADVLHKTLQEASR